MHPNFNSKNGFSRGFDNPTPMAIDVSFMSREIVNVSSEPIFLTDGQKIIVLNPTQQSELSSKSQNKKYIAVWVHYSSANASGGFNLFGNNNINSAPEIAYPFPENSFPTIIKSLGMVAFKNMEEITMFSREHGSLSRYIDFLLYTQSSHTAGIRRTTFRLGKEPLYFISDKKVFEVPYITPQEFQDIKGGISIVSNHKGGTRHRDDETRIVTMISGDNFLSGEDIYAYYEWVDRLDSSDPVISCRDGSLYFSSREYAEEFIGRFEGDFYKYAEWVSNTSAEVHYDRLLKEGLKRNKKRNTKVLEIIGYMGLSAFLTAVSQIVIEKVVEASKSVKDVKNAFC